MRKEYVYAKEEKVHCEETRMAEFFVHDFSDDYDCDNGSSGASDRGGG